MALKCEEAHQLVQFNGKPAECVLYENLGLTGYFDASQAVYHVAEPQCGSDLSVLANGCLCATGIFETFSGSCQPCASGESSVTVFLGTRGVTRFCVAAGSQTSVLQAGKSCDNFDSSLHFCPCASGQVALSNGQCVAFTEPEKFAESCTAGYWYKDENGALMCLRAFDTPAGQIKQSFQNNFSNLRLLLVCACVALFVAVVVILLLLLQEFKKKKQLELKRRAHLERLEADKRLAQPIELPTIASNDVTQPKSLSNMPAYPVNTIRLGQVENSVKLTPMKLGGSQAVPPPQSPAREQQVPIKRRVKKRIVPLTSDVVKPMLDQSIGNDIFSGII